MNRTTEEEEVDLEVEDIRFIRDLFIREYWKKRDPSDAGPYRCVRSCAICRGGSVQRLAEKDFLGMRYFVDGRNEVYLSKEIKQEMMKQVVHEVFEKRWKAKRLKRKRAREMNVRVPRMGFSENKRVNVSYDGSFYRSVRDPLKQKYRQSYHSNDNTVWRLKESDIYMSSSRNCLKIYHNQQKINCHLMDNLRNSRRPLELCPRSNKCKYFGHGRPQQVRVVKRFHHYSNYDAEHSWNNFKDKNEREPGEVEVRPAKEHVVALPVNDINISLILERKSVDIEVYQDGLANRRWNPTQILYEICAQSHWPSPKFYEVDDVPGEGFLWSVLVQDRVFLGPRRAASKRLARHLAATRCLHHLGFRFTYDAQQTSMP